MSNQTTPTKTAKGQAKAGGAQETQKNSAQGQEANAGQATVSYSMSPGLVPRMARERFSIAFSSYQSGLLYMLGVQPCGGAHLHQSGQPKPMGLSFNSNGQLTMTGAFHVIRFENVL